MCLKIFVRIKSGNRKGGGVINVDMATKRDDNIWQKMDNSSNLHEDLILPDHSSVAEDQALPETSIEDATKSFTRVQSQLKAQVGPEVYTSWFGRLKLHSASRNIIRLSVPTTFLKSWINNKYLKLLTKLFQDDNEAIMKVEIIVRSATRVPAAQEQPKLAAPKQLKGPSQRGMSDFDGVAKPAMPAQSGPIAKQDFSDQKVIGSPLDGRFDFSNFIEGTSNRVALAAAKTISESGLGAIPVSYTHLTLPTTSRV